MCVNEDHLEMVTHKENQRRRDARKQERANAKVSNVYPFLSSDESRDKLVQTG